MRSYWICYSWIRRKKEYNDEFVAELPDQGVYDELCRNLLNFEDPAVSGAIVSYSTEELDADSRTFTRGGEVYDVEDLPVVSGWGASMLRIINNVKPS